MWAALDMSQCYWCCTFCGLSVGLGTLVASGVLLKMEVGIRKGAWRRAWRYPAYLWSLRWVYAVKKIRRLVYGVYPRIPPPQYTTAGSPAKSRQTDQGFVWGMGPKTCTKGGEHCRQLANTIDLSLWRRRCVLSLPLQCQFVSIIRNLLGTVPVWEVEDIHTSCQNILLIFIRNLFLSVLYMALSSEIVFIVL